MKNKSFFSHIVLLMLVALICVIMTIVLALFAGSMKTTIFDFRNLNFGNVIPVLIIGGFITCAVVGITALFVSRKAFSKAKDYFIENNKKGEDVK